MSDRLSFISDYVPAREALFEMARVVIVGALRHGGSSGPALAYALQVKATVETLHDGLVQAMECRLVPEANLRASFLRKLAHMYEMVPLPAEVSAPPMVVTDVPNGTTEGTENTERDCCATA